MAVDSVFPTRKQVFWWALSFFLLRLFLKKKNEQDASMKKDGKKIKKILSPCANLVGDRKFF